MNFLLQTSSSPSWALIALFLILLLLVPGTILGWVAAGQIRRSEGQFYGLRLAAFAGMFFPALLLLVLPLVLTALLARLTAVASAFATFDAVLLVVFLFASLSFPCYRIFQVGLRRILGKENVRELFSLKRNRVPLLVLAILWIGAGSLALFQRPRQVDKAVTSTSSDQIFVAKGSTWEQRQVLGSQRVFYRFEVLVHDGAVRAWRDIPIPTSLLESNDPADPESDYVFEDKGSIRWNESQSTVEFLVDEMVVFKTPLNHLLVGVPGASVLQDFGRTPHIEEFPSE